VSGDFTLTPEGGLDPQANFDADYVWSNSNLFYQSRFPQNQARLLFQAADEEQVFQEPE
jgi:hypothetical protein